MPERAFPASFRSEVIKPLVDKLRRGESVSLIGVASIGKGNVMRQLLRKSIRDYYFQDDAARFVLITIDCNFLRDYQDAAVYAEFLGGLAQAAKAFGAQNSPLQPQLVQWARDAQSAAGAPFAQQNLRHALEQLLANSDQRIVFLLDDCDALIERASPALMRGLRALRDAHKDQLMYVTLTRRELARLRPPSSDFEHFFELTPSHMIGIKPYREQDAEVMLDWMASRQKTNVHQLTDEEKHRFYILTGGHAGLLKHTYEATQYGERVLDPDISAKLMGRKLIRAECEKILAGLEEDERSALNALANGRTLSKGIAALKGKGLIREDVPGSFTVFSPLFAEYVRTGTHAPATAAGHLRFVLDRDTGILQLDGRTIHLDALEVELVDLFLSRRPAACEDGEMIARLIVVQPSGVSFKQLYQLLSQLQTKLNTGGKQYLIRDPDTRWRLIGDQES
ncbi:MAG: ATP-binding protein [Chloroflexi bacterium]|nr:ATP-binding protein [Chloroflexota bacterium]